MCTYSEDRERLLIEYLYGDGDPDERATFGAHLERCHTCRAELQGLRGVRRALAGWAPPVPGHALEHEPLRVGPRLATGGWRSAFSQLGAVPAWAQAAAAILCLGVGAGAANLHVIYGTQGLSIQTGWLPQPDVGSVTPAPTAAASQEVEQLRAEVAALRDQVVMQTANTSASVSADNSDDALLKEARRLIAQSEQRQQRELALRIGDMLNDVQAQRRADLSRIERNIGLVQNSTGMEVLRQREMINSLAVRVSTQR